MGRVHGSTQKAAETRHPVACMDWMLCNIYLPKNPQKNCGGTTSIIWLRLILRWPSVVPTAHDEHLTCPEHTRCVEWRTHTGSDVQSTTSGPNLAHLAILLQTPSLRALGRNHCSPQWSLLRSMRFLSCEDARASKPRLRMVHLPVLERDSGRQERPCAP